MKNDIFEEKNIYPHEEKIENHFKEFYNSVYVAFLPFFRIENHLSRNNNYKKSEKITFEQAKKELDILKNMQEPNAEIFSYSNQDYPITSEIYNNGKIVSWKNIVKEIDLKDVTELNKALRTSIGALKEIFRKPELSEKLNIYTEKNNIWHPTEGNFDIFLKLVFIKFLKCLTRMKY